MIREAALTTLICVLFVQMGLSDAVQQVLHVRSRIASCPKCLTMWVTLACLLLHGYGILESAAASFICAYTALWLAMIYD